MKDRLAVLLPTRGDRPEFLHLAERLIERQTRPADEVTVIDTPPADDRPDLGRRLYVGLVQAKILRCKTVAWWEDDDWYAADYLERQLEHHTYPVTGLNDTWYYHLGLRRYRWQEHPGRSSGNSTLMDVETALSWDGWRGDEQVTVDLPFWRWAARSGISTTWRPERPIVVGMKHGHGYCQTSTQRYAAPWLTRASHADPEFDWLEEAVDSEAFARYQGELIPLVSEPWTEDRLALERRDR